MRKAVVILLAVVLAAGLAGGYLAWRHWDRQSMMETTFTWARLAPLPDSAEDFSIATEGLMFTRAFRVRFTAPPADIRRWLATSPGTTAVLPDTLPDGRSRYTIIPGGGAQHAEVTVDETTGAVDIYACWS